MGYVNRKHEGRLVLISRFSNAFSEMNTFPTFSNEIATQLEGIAVSKPLYLMPEVGASVSESTLHHFPYLFHRDGSPWYEANSYLYNIARNLPIGNRPTDDLRRRASKLLDYLMFCEEKDIPWRDFSGRRPTLRPTYRYFAHLCNQAQRSNDVINQYTGAVYGLFKFIASTDDSFDLDRVDSVREVKISFEGIYGRQHKTVVRRGQTKPSKPKSMLSTGFVMDEGEQLRPLTNEELKEFNEEIDKDCWSPTERLILRVALLTGARKQTVLTLKLRHADYLATATLQNDQTFKLQVGPGTGVDTKRDQPQVLRIPQGLAEEIIIYSKSKQVIGRRKKFTARFELDGASVGFGDNDHYLFLSDQGGSYYMARNDPRFNLVSSRPTGQVTDTICRKLLSRVSNRFPRGFTYHWLRATFGYQLYQRLQPLLAAGVIQPGEEISIIQERMHHRHRETTENYLKLFQMHSDRLRLQELYESKLMGIQ
ncbi:site-specific integrase [Pseudomonas putida]